VALLGALLLSYFSWLLLRIDCGEDTQSVCSGGGYAQFSLALTGAAVAAGAVVVALLGRWRPRLWIGASAAIFVVWVVVIFAVGETS
jgi:hypothetical protein